MLLFSQLAPWQDLPVGGARPSLQGREEEGKKGSSALGLHQLLTPVNSVLAKPLYCCIVSSIG